MDVFRLRREFYFRAVRSRGPGGQNVNKVSSAAVLLWPFEYSPTLTDEQKNLIRVRMAAHLSAEGEVMVRSDEFRDLERNKSRCLEKLGVFLEKAFFKPKKRRPTKPTRSSQIKRQDSKRHRGEVKKLRGRVSDD